MELLLAIGLLALLSGFLSGLLGIGGGIIMAPLLLFGPRWLGMQPLSMHTVAGLTIVQSLLGCLAGALSHRRYRFVSGPLVWVMGVSIFLAAALGGALSAWLSGEALLLVFAALALVAALLMFRPQRDDLEAPEVDQLSFSRPRAAAVAAAVGLLGGMVGQGGSFLLIPMMIAVVKVPTRIAIGSNLGIVAASSAAGVAAKALTGQIEWLLTIPVVLAVLPAARLGACVSKRLPVRTLRLLLAALILVAALRLGSEALALGW